MSSGQHTQLQNINILTRKQAQSHTDWAPSQQHEQGKWFIPELVVEASQLHHQEMKGSLYRRRHDQALYVWVLMRPPFNCPFLDLPFLLLHLRPPCFFPSSSVFSSSFTSLHKEPLYRSLAPTGAPTTLPQTSLSLCYVTFPHLVHFSYCEDKGNSFLWNAGWPFSPSQNNTVLIFSALRTSCFIHCLHTWNVAIQIRHPTPNHLKFKWYYDPKDDIKFETIRCFYLFFFINVYKITCASCNHKVCHTWTSYMWSAETMYQTLIWELVGRKRNSGPILGLRGEVWNCLKNLF
jgi:hypothetical protein